MGRLRKSFGAHHAVVLGVVCLYLAVACGVDLFHAEDCPLTNGGTTPSSESCPACKFLAGANSTEAVHESGQEVIESRIAQAPAPDADIVVSKQCTGSIILRGPPLLPIS